MKIIFVSTYSSMVNDIKKIQEEYKDDEILVLDSEKLTRPQIVDIINKSDALGVISRGGLYDYLRSRVLKPIIPINVTSYDILSFLNLNNLNKQMILGFKEITEFALKLHTLGHLPIEVKTIEKSDEIFEIMKTLDKSFDIFSGYTTYQILKKNGFKAHLIISSLDSIRESINRLKIYINNLNQEMVKERVFEAYIAEDGMNIYIYQNKELYIKKISNKELDEEITEEIEKRYDKLLSPKKVEFILYKNDHILKIYNHHFKALGNMYIAVKTTKYKYPYSLSDFSIEHLNQSFNIPKNIQDESDIYSNTKIPLILIGKDSLLINHVAKYIISNSTFSDSTSFYIDFNALTDKGIDKLLNDSSSVFNLESHCIIIKSISNLNKVKQQELKNYFLNSDLLVKNKVIFLDNNPDFLKEYLDDIMYYFLYIDNTRNLTKNYVDEYFEKEDIMLNSDIVTLLKSYPFKSEEQFLRIMNELEINKNITYKNLLERLLDEQSKKDVIYSENIDELNKDYIMKMLEKYNYNQSLVSKKIGISRTTIWRILNNKK